MFGKIFSSMFEGSLAGTGETWAVFVFLIAHCDAEGFVDIHPRSVAQRTGFAEDRVRAALVALMAPDPESRSKELDGARLELIDSHRDWGWRIVNYLRYRKLTDKETVRAEARVRVQRHRAEKGKNVTPRNAHVTRGNARKQQEEVEVEVEEESKSKDSSLRSSGVSSPRSRSEPTDPENRSWSEMFDWFWVEYPKKVGKPAALRAWKAIRPQTQATVEAIGAGLETWRPQWTDPQFIPHPSTWLNQHRWEDQP